MRLPDTKWEDCCYSVDPLIEFLKFVETYNDDTDFSYIISAISI